MKIGYVVPEWPGQTHLWIWREICHLREWGVPLRIFATRRAKERDRGRHAFVAQAEAETFYLWPIGRMRGVWLLLCALCTSPIGLIRCIGLALTLPVDKGPRWKTVLPLIMPAALLARQVLREGIKHLHSHTPANSAILCMMVKRLTGVPYSLIVNANIEWWGGAMREKFEEASFTLLVTEWLVTQMKRDFPSLPVSRYAMGRVGVDTRKWSRSSPEQAVSALARSQAKALGSVDETFRVLSVGRLNQSKGFDVLLKAVAELKSRGVNVALHIGGDGPEREALAALVSQLQIADRVTFLGSVSEEQYLAEMAEADCFVLASTCEPMGVVYMEAMAMEVATIGTNAGGVPEIITDGVDGMLVPPMDPSALAAAIGRLIGEPAFRRELGRCGREKILAQFDSRIWAGALYSRIFGHAPPDSASDITGSKQPKPAAATRRAGGEADAVMQEKLTAAPQG